jgi:hypothetical protein
MDRRQAIEALPAIHASALRLLDGGETPDRVAAQLGLEPEELATLIHIAEAKVARLLRESGVTP